MDGVFSRGGRRDGRVSVSEGTAIDAMSGTNNGWGESSHANG